MVNELLLTITNVGDSLLRNVSVTINPSSQIALIGFDGKWYVGTLKFNESKVLKFTVYPSSLQSTYLAQLNMVVNYVNSYGTIVSENVPLSIIIIPNTGIIGPSISISTRILKAGSVNNLTLAIINNSTDTMKSATLTISFSGGAPTILTPNNIFIGSIKSRDEISIPISIYMPATSLDTINMIVAISYYNEQGTSMQYSQSLGLLILSPSDLRLTNYVILPQPVILGQPFSITLTLTNMGIGPANNVYASVLSNRYFTLVTGNQVYVGSLQSGASSTITFSFMSTNVTMPRNVTFTRTFTGEINRTRFPALGNFTVVIILTYQDNLQYTHRLNITIPIRVTESATTGTQRSVPSTASGLNYTILTIIGVIILAIIIMVFVIRRRRNENK